MPAQICFDLDTLTVQQATAIRAMLDIYAPQERGTLKTSAPAFPGNFREANAPSRVVSSATITTEAEAEAEAEPDPKAVTPFSGMYPAPDPVEVEEKPKRVRRTKAEMEAAKSPTESTMTDNEAFVHFLAQFNDQMDAAHIDSDKRRATVKEWEARCAADPAQALLDIQTALGKNALFLKKVEAAKAENQEVKAPTLDDLRAALNAYVASHDFDKGLALVAKYGGARVSDILTKDLAVQLLFLEEANA